MEQQEKKNPTFLENAQHYFAEFCERTSTHGFNFLGERKRTISERVWWATIVAVSIYFSIAMVYQSYSKWKNSPVLVTFATEHTSIWQIPFPAVTICPENKADRDLYNFTEYYVKKEAGDDLTPEEEAKFEYMALLCSADDDLLKESYRHVNVSALDFLYEVQPNFADSVIGTNWRGKDHTENLTGIFSPIITSQGMCHTFNVMDRSEFFTDIVYHYKDTFSSNGQKTSWTVENGYAPGSDINAYPRRTMIAGTKGGLDIMVHTSRDDIDPSCGDSFLGFQIVLHPPDEIPRVKQKYFRLPLDHSLIVAVKPKMMTTSEDLKPYLPEVRKCYFEGEKHLKYFRIYNQENCMLECLANFTLQECGCVSMHSPREKATPICGAAIRSCLENAKATFTNNQENPKTRCDCLQSCNSLSYETEISYSRWNWRPMFEIQRQTKAWKPTEYDDLLSNRSHCSHLVIYYKDMQFITSTRNELYSTADFWSNCGGLLGLFTGATFISVCELFYYLTIRVLFNMRMFGARYWSGSKELLKFKDAKD